MDLRDLFNYGVPTGILFILMFSLWKITLWAREKIVVPVVEAHLNLIKAFQENIPKQTEAIIAIRKSNERVLSELIDQSKNLESIVSNTEETAAKGRKYPDDPRSLCMAKEVADSVSRAVEATVAVTDASVKKAVEEAKKEQTKSNGD